jgi:hypothetical protein
MPNPSKIKKSDSDSFFEQYWRHCSSLRNWFVAYGVGGSVLLLTDKARIFDQMRYEEKRCIIFSFAVGIIAQIVLAFINKVIHWYVYCGREDAEFAKTWRYEVSVCLSECFWIDITADIISFLAFGIATTILFMAI